MQSQDLSSLSNTPSHPEVEGVEEPSRMIPVECCDRWQAYFRLKELGIPCQCEGYQPLLVDMHTAQGVIQVWSVLKHVSTPRSELVRWLDQCWQLPS